MKNFIVFFWVFILLINNVFAESNIQVSATVWNVDIAPIITRVNPNSNPRILQANNLQAYSISIKDTDTDTIYYTITPKYGYTSHISWSIEINQTGTFNFLYLAPDWNYTDEKITVTINDWTNVITKTLNLYIYE